MVEITNFISSIALGLGFISMYLAFTKYRQTKAKYLFYYLISFSLTQPYYLMIRLPALFPDFYSEKSVFFATLGGIIPIVGLYFYFMIVKSFNESFFKRPLLFVMNSFFAALVLLIALQFYIDGLTTLEFSVAPIFNPLSKLFQLSCSLIAMLQIKYLPEGKAKPVFYFGLLYTFGIVFEATFFFLNNIGVVSDLIYYQALTLLKLVINAAPILWLKPFISSFEGINSELLKKNEINAELLRQYGISKRETEVIELLCQGKTNKEISAELFISVATVKEHIYKIFRKTDVSNRVQVANLFRQ